MRRLIGLALLLTLAACDRSEPPAARVAETAGKIVQPAASTPPVLAPGRFAPRDECTDIPGASAFRARLSTAIRDRDPALLAPLAANDIKLDFGGGTGAAELRSRLSGADNPLWSELQRMLSLGCAANAQGGITIPWIAAQELTLRDTGSAMLVTGSEVPVYSAPDAAAPEIGRVTWDVVAIEALQPGAAFQPIALPDGTRGFMATGSLRSMLDYRLTAARRNNRWTVTSLVAGD